MESATLARFKWPASLYETQDVDFLKSFPVQEDAIPGIQQDRGLMPVILEHLRAFKVHRSPSKSPPHRPFYTSGARHPLPAKDQKPELDARPLKELENDPKGSRSCAPMDVLPCESTF